MIARMTFAALVAVIALPALACERGNGGENAEPEIRFEISRSERQLYVYRGDEVIRTEAVSVGQPEWPTPTGEWHIHQVDWNPDWTPPDSEWAEGDEYTPPGHPDNPMGRARIVFAAPYTIHGTDILESLGQAQSHGSVRVANEAVIELARLVMEEGGAGRSEEWYQETLDNPTEMRQVDIPNPIPIRIRD